MGDITLADWPLPERLEGIATYAEHIFPSYARWEGTADPVRVLVPESIREAIAALQSEKARADAAEADARRYRWLWRRHPAALLNIFDPHGAHDYDETDSLIDAAMKVGATHD